MALRPTGVSQAELIQILYDLQTAVNALRGDLNALATKLNADAGVTDVDYAASTALAVSGVSVS